MKYFNCLTLFLLLLSSQVFAELRGYGFSGTIDTVADDGSMDQFLGGTYRGQFTFDDEAQPYSSDPTISRYPGAELLITYFDVNGTDYTLRIQNATFAVLDNYAGAVDGFAINNPDEQIIPAIIETDLPLPNSGQHLNYPVRLLSAENITNGTSPTQEIDPDLSSYIVTDIAIHDQTQDEQGNNVYTSYLSGPIQSFIEYDVTAPIEANNFNRGYAFTGTIDTVAEDGSMDQFLGGTYRGQFLFNDEAAPYHSDPTIARHLSAELSVTYTDVNGVDYTFNMTNATFAVLDNYGGAIDGFAVNNPDEQIVPSIIDTDLPLPNAGQNLNYPVRLLSFEDITNGTSPTQEIGPDLPSYLVADIAIHDQTQNGYTVYLRGPLDSFEEFYVSPPSNITFTNSLNIGNYGYEGSFSYDDATGVYDLQSGGAALGHWEDWFHFVYEEVSGDVDFSARISYISEGWSSAGIMIRDDLTTYSKQTSSLITLYNGGRFSIRKEPATLYPDVEVPVLAEGSWLRLVKQGNQVSNYISDDGETWTLVGTETIEFGDSFYIGLVGVAEGSGPATNIIVDEVGIELQ